MTKELQALVQLEKKHLTDKKPHTKHKIDYVCEYVKEWLYVSCNSENENLNFIDCMSNAGVYADGDLCTAVEVLKIFCQFAYKNPEKTFNILFNDLSADRIRIAKEVCNLEIKSLPKNVNIFFDNIDVNDYIRTVKGKYNLFTFPSRTILFVDPFDFRTVNIPTLKQFVQYTYCELIFNMFTSDFVRNGVDSGIAKSLGGNYVFANKEELWEHVAKTLLVGKMKHCLSYPFRNSKNVELYQILFLTPSDKGLDKLKQAIWNTFNGQEYFKTETVPVGQLSFFTAADDKDSRAKSYAEEAFMYLSDNYGGQILAYSDIESIILGHSLLMTTQLLTYVIKPKIASKQLIKQNKVKSSNYKKDSYLIRGVK